MLQKYNFLKYNKSHARFLYKTVLLMVTLGHGLHFHIIKLLKQSCGLCKWPFLLQMAASKKPTKDDKKANVRQGQMLSNRTIIHV